MGDAMLMEKCKAAEYLGENIVGFEGGNGPGAVEELMEVTSCAVWHDETEFRALIVEKVGDWEDVGVGWV